MSLSLIRLIPQYCPMCNMRRKNIAASFNGSALCVFCANEITKSMFDGRPRCPRCSLVIQKHINCPDCIRVPSSFSRVIAAFDYSEPGDMLIHMLKAQRNFSIAPVVASLMVHAWVHKGVTEFNNFYVVPVPASEASLRKRGFNPAAQIAKEVVRQLKFKYSPKTLIRLREGQKQAHSDREQRIINTFALYGVGGPVKGVPIMVIDDVLTTGATMHSIAKLLLSAGASSVYGLVAARAPA